MKKLLSLLLALSLAAPLEVRAECSKQVTLLEQGTPAPCKGFLFSPEKEQQVYLLNEKYKLIQQELDLKNQFIDRYKKDSALMDDILEKERQKSELWRTTAVQSTTQLIEVKENQGKRDMWMILTGVALTVLAGWSVGQASK